MGDYKADPNDSTKQIPNTTYSQGEGVPQTGTTTERTALSPADGYLFYDTTLDKLYVRAAGAWVIVGSQS